MKTLRLFAALFALAVEFAPTPALAAPPQTQTRAAAPAAALPAAPVLHLLSVADSNDAKIGTDVEADARNVVAAFETAFRTATQADRLRTTLLLGTDVTARNVLAAVRGLGVRPQDTVVVFVSGHGGIDDDGRHHLSMDRGARLARPDVLAAMAAARPHLAVLLTDVCSSYTSRGPRKPAVRPTEAVELPVGRVIPWATVEDLFFTHRGVVDVTAAEPGYEAQVERRKPGSYFANALLEILAAPRAGLVAGLDRNADLAVEWKEVLPQLRAAAAARHTADDRGGRPQQAYDWSLGHRPGR